MTCTNPGPVPACILKKANHKKELKIFIKQYKKLLKAETINTLNNAVLLFPNFNLSEMSIGSRSDTYDTVRYTATFKFDIPPQTTGTLTIKF